ncbi:MAG: dockerin type I repeat-containing protein [Oscillospiraceae bacterium]|nr:dockerin type I repeat-containing protein [Oscillospiraceae bacterium]
MKLHYFAIILSMAVIFQPMPAHAEEDFEDFFLVTDADQKLAEYYYSINGVSHHVTADFSLNNKRLAQDKYFIIRGNFYIKNGTPIQIKLGLKAFNKPSEIYYLPAPDGDANGDEAIDILDIITINKTILGKEILSAERLPHIDFNKNGVPDSDDALTMLKMLVGLI